MNDEAVVTQVLADYYSAFSKLDVQAVLPYFHHPTLLVSPGGVVAPPTSDALAAIFGPVMEGLRARGYGRSKLDLERVRVLGSTAALANGVALRYKADGQELERVGVAYVLHKASSDWKITALVIHDID